VRVLSIIYVQVGVESGPVPTVALVQCGTRRVTPGALVQCGTQSVTPGALVQCGTRHVTPGALVQCGTRRVTPGALVQCGTRRVTPGALAHDASLQAPWYSVTHDTSLHVSDPGPCGELLPVRPNKKIGVVPVSRPSLLFPADPKHFLVKKRKKKNIVR
jgi:hypothetical protein